MLIIDDGTFTVGNSFVTLIELDTYHALRQTASWIDVSVTDAKKEAAAIRAFDFFKVQNWSSDAFLTEIPQRVKDAQCVAAAKELDSSGVLQADLDPNVKRQRIEGAIETEYFSKNLTTSTIFTEIINLINPYLVQSRSTVTRTLVRM